VSKEAHVEVRGVSGATAAPPSALHATVRGHHIAVEVRDPGDGFALHVVHVTVEEWLWFAHEVERYIRGVP
jgi:hypothetical protein